MNRKKQELSSVRISDEEYSRLENKFEALRNEFTACKRKLDSKCEALLILSKELDQCRSERDQFKLMAEQLRERYQSIKKQTSGQPIASNSDTRLYKKYSDTQSQNLAKLLCDSRDTSKSLKFEVEDLKQKLHDAQGDIKLLREQIARQRVGTTDEGMNTRHFPAHEREELVQKLESSKDQYLQLERDLQTVLDEKEELVSERDVYKTKYERLNQELNYILKGDENRVVDIDALVMENKYLQERLKQMEEEQSMAMAAVSKYKSLLEKKKNKGCMKLGQSRGGGLIITQKQVQQVLETQSTVMASPQAMSDLQALAGALLDSMNDKNLALSHQRKTNKILGSRVAELEKKLKTLEVAGLWSVPSEVSASLEKLRQECDNVKTLIPRQSSDAGESEKMSDGDKDSELGTVTPLDSPFTTPEPSPTHSSRPLGHLELEDLDLLPTKEVSSIPGVPHDRDNITYDIKNPVSNYVYDIPKFTSAGLLGLPETYSTEEVNIPKNDLVASDNNYASNVHETDNIMHIHGEAEDANVFKTSETDNLLTHDTKNMNIHESDMMRDMHVYNEDLVDESDEKINGDELELDGDALNETEQFYSTESKSIIKSTALRKDIPNKDSEETDDEDAETSEKISLLMENMTQKMCSISHDVSNNDHVDSVSKSAVSSAGEGEVRNGQDLPLRPHDTQKVEDGPKDVEC